MTINREPTSDNEVKTKNYANDSIDEGTILRFNQTKENYFKVSVGSDTYNPTKYSKTQITGTTKIKVGNTGANLLQNGSIICNDKSNIGKKKTLKNQQKHIFQPVIRGQQIYHLSVMVLCI